MAKSARRPGDEAAGEREKNNSENVKVMSFYDLENILRWNHNELKWCLFGRGRAKTPEVAPTTTYLLNIIYL